MNRLIIVCFCSFTIGCTYKDNAFQVSTPKVEQQLDNQYLLNDFKVLASDQFQGRKTGTEGSELAQQFLITQLQQHKIQPFKGEYKHQFYIPRKKLMGNNIIATVPGYNTTNKVIVISAHYDHLGKASYQHIFNGADDNASGTAAVLSIAKQIALTPLKHNVVFLFSDAEEFNLLGAKAFLAGSDSFKGNIILNINLDMLAGSHDQKMLFTIDKHLSKLLMPIYIEQLKLLQHSMEPKVHHNFYRSRGENINQRVSWTKASDHGAFNRYKIPYIYFGVGTHKNYHTFDDTFENANKVLFVKNVENIYKQLIFIDNFLH